MSEKVVLCDGKQMLENLLKVCDLQDFRFCLYPKWLRQAGKSLDVQTAVRMVILTIDDYINKDGPPEIWGYIARRLMPYFVCTLFADDKDAEKVLNDIIN